MLGLVKFDVEVGVNSCWKLRTRLPNKIDAFGLFGEEVVFMLAVRDALITEVDIRAIREDRKA